MQTSARKNEATGEIVVQTVLDSIDGRAIYRSASAAAILTDEIRSEIARQVANLVMEKLKPLIEAAFKESVL